MRVVFRTDSSTMIGSGHAMRCLALADQLRRSGGEVHFICRDYPGNLSPLLGRLGMRVHLLRGLTSSSGLPEHTFGVELGYSDWLGATWEEDAAQTAEVISSLSKPVDWLVVDHYAIDAHWEAALRPMATKIMVIDDLANRPHNCDVLLDQNLNQRLDERYDSLIPSQALRLLGPRYALLRPQFAQARSTQRIHDGSVRRLLIFFGGIDAGNDTSRVLRAIKEIAAPDIDIDIILGPACPHIAIVSDIVSGMPRAQLHVDPHNVAEIMGNADLAVGAVGVTAWERCSVGLPTIMISQAENQESAARAMSDNGLGVYLGRSDAVTGNMISSAIVAFMHSPERMRAMRDACLNLTDGEGIRRVLRALDIAPIKLRIAQLKDCEAIYEWRNSAKTLRYSHDPNVIPIATHIAWFQDTLRNPDKIMLIGERSGQPVGVLRYDCRQGSCTVSVYLVPRQYGHGYGSRLLQAGHAWLQHNRPDIQQVDAEILADNRASIAAFTQLGYRQQSGSYVKNV